MVSSLRLAKDTPDQPVPAVATPGAAMRSQAAEEAVYVERLRSWAVIAAAIVMAIGCLVLVGWSFGIEGLKRVSTGFVAMNPVSALTLVISGGSLIYLARARADARQRLLGQALAFFPLLVGSLKLAALLNAAPFEVDQLLFPELLRPASGIPDRMAPTVALNFVLLGGALIMLGIRRRVADLIGEALALLAFLGSVVLLLGYFYGTGVLHRVGTFIPMAIHTAASMLLLSTGILAARPVAGVFAVLARSDMGGRMARELFPATIIVLVGIAYLRVLGEKAGWYDIEIGSALTVVASLLAMGAMIWSYADTLSLVDSRRMAVEAALRRSEAALRDANLGLMERATTDKLTGVRNRAAFDAEIERTVQIYQENPEAIYSLIMLDIDSFKSFNDTYGHPAGDEVLQRFGQLLTNAVRMNDMVARYGGEEFVVILPRTDRPGAMILADRVRVAIAEAKWEKRPITISAGVSTVRATDATVQAITHEADQALYRAKALGKNRVVHAHDA